MLPAFGSPKAAYERRGTTNISSSIVPIILEIRQDLQYHLTVIYGSEYHRNVHLVIWISLWLVCHKIKCLKIFVWYPLESRLTYRLISRLTWVTSDAPENNYQQNSTQSREFWKPCLDPVRRAYTNKAKTKISHTRGDNKCRRVRNPTSAIFLLILILLMASPYPSDMKRTFPDATGNTVPLISKPGRL